MASTPQRPRSRRRSARATLAEGKPWLWLGGTLFIYGVAGLMLASFPIAPWVWYLALGGILAQALALAGAKALARFRWLAANGLALLAIAGTGAMGVALALALNYVGTDRLDDIVPQVAAVEVIKMSLTAVIIAALGGIISAETGDRLLDHFNRLQTSFILAAACIVGLGLGGLVGLVAVVGI